MSLSNFSLPRSLEATIDFQSASSASSSTFKKRKDNKNLKRMWPIFSSGCFFERPIRNNAVRVSVSSYRDRYERLRLQSEIVLSVDLRHGNIEQISFLHHRLTLN